jgi:hypothetical protein
MPMPVKITCELASPLAGDAPMLDALVEWVMSIHMISVMKSSGGHHHLVEPRGRGQPVSEPGRIPIPICREVIDGLPIPLCSSPILGPVYSDGVEHVGKALALEWSHLLAPSERKIVSTTGGWTKSYRLPLRIRSVERIVWFAAVKACAAPSDRNRYLRELRKLLRHAYSIGKKTADGYGRVAIWRVEEWSDDWSWFASSDVGPVLMRPLPASARLPLGLLGYRPDFCAVTPPYWQRDFWKTAVSPC